MATYGVQFFTDGIEYADGGNPIREKAVIDAESLNVGLNRINQDIVGNIYFHEIPTYEGITPQGSKVVKDVIKVSSTAYDVEVRLVGSGLDGLTSNPRYVQVFEADT